MTIAETVLEATGEPLLARSSLAITRAKQAEQLAALGAHMLALLDKPPPSAEARAAGLQSRPGVEVQS